MNAHSTSKRYTAKEGEDFASKDRILIAEADPLTAQDIKERLESLNYEVAATATSAREAIALAQQLKPDLVIMDIQFRSDMDSIEAAQQLRMLDLAVVFVTGYCDDALLERARSTRPHGYIFKPYDTRNLKTSVELGIYKHRQEQEREMLTQQLEAALANFKLIAGILPICAYCKKVKDHEGVWNQMDTYIMHQTTAFFAHGLCPDCFEKIVGQMEVLERQSLPPGSLVLG
jgi:CheY-like chemotaxis protein